MKHTLAIGGTLIAALLIAAAIYKYAPQDLSTGEDVPAPGVATSTAPVTPAPEPAAVIVAFKSIQAGTHSGTITVRKNYAVMDADGLKKLWNMAFGAEATTTPAIDFKTKQVIGVFAGTKPTGGYGIEVTKVVDSATTRTLFITTLVPGPDCMVTEALTSPYQIISLPTSTLPLAHQDATSTRACN